MKRTFYKVLNKIKFISSVKVVFENKENNGTTGLNRVGNYPRITIWQLRSDGIYVRREYAAAYDLVLEKN